MVLLLHFGNLPLCRFNSRLLGSRHNKIVHAPADTGTRHRAETKIFHTIREKRRLFASLRCQYLRNQSLQIFLGHFRIHESKRLRQNIIQENAPDRRIDNLVIEQKFHARIRINQSRIMKIHTFFHRTDDFPFALRPLLDMRQIVDTEHHIERRCHHRLAGSGLQKVLRRQHEIGTLSARLIGKRDMHRHLIAVEVRIERRTHQWVQTNRLPFDKHRLKRLNGKSVQCRRTVQKHIVMLDDFIQNFVRLFRFRIHHTPGGSHVVRVFLLNHLVDDKGLEELQRHLFRQSGLMELQLRTNNNN